MERTEHQFFVCNSFRLSGEPKGVCNKKGAPDLLRYLEDEIADRGIDGAVIVAGCLNVCAKGPALIHYPSGDSFGPLDEEGIDMLLDGVEEGTLPESLKLT